MNKIFYLLLPILLLIACESKKKEVTKDEHSAEYALDYEGVYRGTYPCADCSGIQATLTLKSDKTFIYETIYLGKKDGNFVSKGNYTVKGNILTIKENGKPINFKVGESALTLLGDDLKPNTGKLAEHYLLKKQRGFTYQGLYKGTYPCADCSGIKVELTLNTDNTFIYETVYLEKKDGRFVHKGNYTVKENILSFKENDKVINFLIGENTLTFLGDSLKPNTGKMARFYILKKQGNFNYQGNYETFNDKKDGYSQTLSIQPKGSGYEVVFSASKVKNRENCRFSGIGTIKNDTLWVDISNEKDKKVPMYIAPSHDNLGVDIFTPNFDERFYMMRYCGGGSSLAGVYIKNVITSNSIGVFNNTNTIEDVLHTIPCAQVNKKKGEGEFAEDVYDDYEIYAHNDQHLFTVTPKDTANLSQKINRVLVKSPFLKTEKGINIKSTYKDIKNAYKITKIEPTREHIVLIVDDINAQFNISKKALKKGWWNDKTKKVNENKIPLEAQIDEFILWWND